MAEGEREACTALEPQVPFANQKPWQSFVMWEAQTSQVTK